MTLNVNLLFCRLSHAYCDHAAEARITLFHCRTKVQLQAHLSYPHIKFDDEIGIPSNFKHNFVLTCCLSCVTRVYCDETTVIKITRCSLQSS